MKQSLIILGLLAGTALTPALAHADPTDEVSSSSAQDSPRWRVVDRADVNGDGTKDRIAFRRTGPKACQVRVNLGKDGTARRTVRSRWGSACDYRGSGPLNAVRGAEISVVTDEGAHTPWHTILTWTDGVLVVERAVDRMRWTVDSTVMWVEGYTRIKRAGQPPRLIHHVLTTQRGQRWRGTRDVLVYDDHAWARLSRTRVNLGPRMAAKRAGWHVPGFPRGV